MVVLRCTRKLLRHLPQEEAAEPAASTTRLGDWFANLIVGRRQHIMLAVSGVTLLPAMIPAAPYKTMIPRFVEGTGEILRALGIVETAISAETSAMREAVVAATNDRRVLGSMNDFAWMMDGYLQDANSLHEVALKLAQAPCSPLGMQNPREATLALFAASRLRLVKQS